MVARGTPAAGRGAGPAMASIDDDQPRSRSARTDGCMRQSGLQRSPSALVRLARGGAIFAALPLQRRPAAWAQASHRDDVGLGDRLGLREGGHSALYAVLAQQMQ